MLVGARATTHGQPLHQLRGTMEALGDKNLLPSRHTHTSCCLCCAHMSLPPSACSAFSAVAIPVIGYVGSLILLAFTKFIHEVRCKKFRIKYISCCQEKNAESTIQHLGKGTPLPQVAAVTAVGGTRACADLAHPCPPASYCAATLTVTTPSFAAVLNVRSGTAAAAATPGRPAFSGLRARCSPGGARRKGPPARDRPSCLLEDRQNLSGGRSCPGPSG